MKEKEGKAVMEAIVASAHAAHKLRQVKHLSSVRSQREQNLFKKTINNLLETLICYEHELERADQLVGESVTAVFDGLYDYLAEVSKVELHETAEKERLLKAHKKDPKSINGIVNKIL